MEVDLEHAVPGLGGHVERGPARGDAGVVHEDVHAPRRGDRAGDHRLDLRRIREVGRHDVAPSSERFHVPRERIRRVTAHGDDVGSPAGQGGRDASADPSGGSGHDGDQPFEVEHLRAHVHRFPTFLRFPSKILFAPGRPGSLGGPARDPAGSRRARGEPRREWPTPVAP